MQIFEEEEEEGEEDGAHAGDLLQLFRQEMGTDEMDFSASASAIFVPEDGQVLTNVDQSS